jgi:glyoxylase-like metal-dependent hydrolase (beta-lactamase superfamily II)
VHFSQTSHTVVLTGDALVTGDGIAGRTGPSIVNAAFTHVTAQALDSLEALAGLDAEVVLPGHGRTVHRRRERGRPPRAARGSGLSSPDLSEFLGLKPRRKSP